MAVLIKGVNDLATLRPDLAKEWDQEKNGSLTPDQVTCGSNKRVHWKCSKCGHEWPAHICERSRGTGCKACVSRLQTSFQEQAMYFYVKKICSDAVNRDTSLGREADILIPSMKCAIEINGDKWHKERVASDNAKKDLFESNGIYLYVLTEAKSFSIYNHTVTCSFKRRNKLSQGIKAILDMIFPGNNIDVDVERDEIAIREQMENMLVENSIAKTHPHLVKEWDNEKNGTLRPEYFTAGSDAVVFWKCDKGHSYPARISSRAIQHTKCPYCTNRKVLVGFNDLATTDPWLAKQWNYKKNKKTPQEVTANCNAKAWWICDDCKHEWPAYIKNRHIKHSNCPKCHNKMKMKLAA